MKRLLLSWVAAKNDFIDNGVNTDGPTFNFHQYFYNNNNYERHILLSSEKESMEYSRDKKLFSQLKQEFRHNIINLRFMDIQEGNLINFNYIHSKIYPLLLEFKEYEIDIFVSPGTPTMQVVWYITHLELNINTRLIQTNSKAQSKTAAPELSVINFRKAPFVQFHLLTENLLTSKTDKEDEYYISKHLIPIYNLAKEVAQTPKTIVLINGETGTGKEHLAEQIHKYSSRKDKPFIAVNCASIASDILESRLFGHEQGAFTGAVKSTKGYFQEANGGTLFLDEIGDISPQMQVSLLRAIQKNEIQKVGSSKIEKTDVRFITATNKNLYEECCKGNFRWDLYYRLNVAELSLPPLRQRGADEIEGLIKFFCQKYYNYLRGIRRKLHLHLNQWKF